MIARFGNMTAEYRTSRYGNILLQYDLYGVSRLTQTGSTNMRTKGAPDTVKLPIPVGKTDWNYMTENFQRWLFKLNWSRTPSMPEADAKASWRSLFSGQGVAARAFTDYAGSDTNADYINEAHLDAEPMKLKMIICPSFVKIIGEDNRNVIKTEDCWIIEAIDPLSDLERYSLSSHRHLFFFPSISIRIPYRDKNGSFTGKFIEYVSEPFPHFNNLVVMPIVGRAGQPFQYVPKSRIALGDYPKSPFRNTTERDLYHNYTTYKYPNPY